VTEFREKRCHLLENAHAQSGVVDFVPRATPAFRARTRPLQTKRQSVLAITGAYLGIAFGVLGRQLLI
jgi:hypothetical protein